MIRLTITLMFVIAVAYVTADEDSKCTETKDCPCGSICNDENCTPGCQLFDTFIEAGSDSVVYGRKCSCGDTPDERGMILECEEGVEYTGAPEGVTEWENNPGCEEDAGAAA